jgi:hypothetical protein
MQAQELKRNEWVKGAVKKGQYSYFKFKHKCTKGRVCIQLKTTGGDPDIYVGNHQVMHRCLSSVVPSSALPTRTVSLNAFCVKMRGFGGSESILPSSLTKTNTK